MAKKQNEVVTTNNDINVVSMADLDRFEALDKRIENAVRSQESAMMSIMGALAVIHEKKLYIAGGYDSVKSYYLDRYGMEIKKTALSEAVNAFRRFGDMETGLLKDEWSGYTYSQLKIMQRLTDKELEKVDVSTSCRAIQQIINDRNALIEDKNTETTETETENNENVSRETSVVTKEETSGQVEPYIEMTFDLEEFANMDATDIKLMIMDAFSNDNYVVIKYRV